MKTSTIVQITGWLMMILDMVFGEIRSVTFLASIIVVCTGLIIQAIEEK